MALLYSDHLPPDSEPASLGDNAAEYLVVGMDAIIALFKQPDLMKNYTLNNIWSFRNRKFNEHAIVVTYDNQTQRPGNPMNTSISTHEKRIHDNSTGISSSNFTGGASMSHRPPFGMENEEIPGTNTVITLTNRNSPIRIPHNSDMPSQRAKTVLVQDELHPSSTHTSNSSINDISTSANDGLPTTGATRGAQYQNSSNDGSNATRCKAAGEICNTRTGPQYPCCADASCQLLHGSSDGLFKCQPLTMAYR